MRQKHPSKLTRIFTRPSVVPLVFVGALFGATSLDSVSAQEPETTTPVKRSKFATVDESDLVLLHYTPRRAADRLSKLAYQMWGRQFVTASGGRDIRRNIFQNVESIVIFDESDRANRILKMLADLDQARGPVGESAPDLKSVILNLRHASMSDARQALKPFTRILQLRAEDGSNYMAPNIEYIDMRSSVIVRDEKKNIDSIRDVLAKLDSPRPQVMLTCWVVRGTKEAAEEGAMELPPELSQDLKKLVRNLNFTALGMGLLNATIEPRGKLSLAINLEDKGQVSVSAVCKGFDETHNVLHLDLCECRFNAMRSQPQQFKTKVSLRASEYTVLGAMGSQPVFVVLKVVRRGKAN